jgi:uncharacterized damage-inducible protein DinB
MYEYSAWANERILAGATRLSGEQYRAEEGASFGGVHDTLVHTMSAQWIYLARWTGTSPSAPLDSRAFPDLAAVRQRWDRIEADTREFIAGLADGDLLRAVEYVNTDGERWAYPLWQQMLHQVNHATQHRSEVAMVLTRFGQSPGWLDFLYFLDLQAAAKRPAGTPPASAADRGGEAGA